MKDTRVYLLDCGTMALDQTYMFMDAGLTGMRRFPVYGVLVDHGLFQHSPPVDDDFSAGDEGSVV
jgi:hypothetical protein